MYIFYNKRTRGVLLREKRALEISIVSEVDTVYKGANSIFATAKGGKVVRGIKTIKGGRDVGLL